MFEIAPVNPDNSIPPEALCQEASVMSRGSYIPCNDRAVAIVRHDKDRRSYYMCLPCADHNCRSRGGKLVASLNRDLVQRFGYAPKVEVST